MPRDFIRKGVESGQMTRALLLVQQTVNKSTQKLYEHHIEKFRKFTGIIDLDSLVKLPVEQLQIMVEDYLMHLKGKLSPNTIPVAMAPIKSFFVMNDINLNFEKIHRMYPAKVKKSGNRSYDRKQIQEMLRYATKKRVRALILFLASTGCRIGALEELKISNIEKMPDGCYRVLFYEGSTEEYYGFLTPEAGKALEEYWDERRNDRELLGLESPVFREDYRGRMVKAKRMTTQSAQMLLYKCIKRSGIHRKKMGERYEIQMAHGIRKYFNTTLKLIPNLNYNVAEKLMGHKNGLDGVYFTATKEQCYEEFKKAIPELTIDDTERKDIAIMKLKEEKAEYEKKIPEIIAQAVERAKEELRKEGHVVDFDKKSVQS